MPTSITMPQLGESVAEGTIAKWLKRPGERVERDEPLVEVITDKVNAEIPSPAAGVLERIIAPEGTTVAVGAEIAIIGDGSQASPAPAEPAATASATATIQQQREPSVETARAAASPEEPHAAPPVGTDGGTAGLLETGQQEGPRFYTPVVMRMAREHGIDLSKVEGTGLGGRVTKKDLERYIEQHRLAAAPTPVAEAAPAAVAAPAAPSPAPAAPAPPPPPAAPMPAVAAGADEEHLPVSPIRKAIAEHMVRSLATAPHAWGMVEVDMTEVARLRDRVQADWRKREGFELTYLPFVLKAVAEALREHPVLNATWDQDHVVLKKRIHLGIAVATDTGLFVPVIRDADQLSLVGLARALRALVQKARAGKLTLEDVQGGTFTVNNTGALGSILSQPIINQPQAAILTTEAVVKRPVVLENDAIAIRQMMNLCCSFDHRVLDGAQALRFLNAVKRRLESYRPDSAVL